MGVGGTGSAQGPDPREGETGGVGLVGTGKVWRGWAQSKTEGRPGRTQERGLGRRDIEREIHRIGCWRTQDGGVAGMRR